MGTLPRKKTIIFMENLAIKIIVFYNNGIEAIEMAQKEEFL